MISLACGYPPQFGVKMGLLIAEALQVRQQLEQRRKTEHMHMKFSAVNPMWKLMPLQFMVISEDDRPVEAYDVAALTIAPGDDKSPYVVQLTHQSN